MIEKNSCVNSKKELFNIKEPVPHFFPLMKSDESVRIPEPDTDDKSDEKEDWSFPIVKRDAQGIIDYQYYDKRARSIRSEAFYSIAGSIFGLFHKMIQRGAANSR